MWYWKIVFLYVSRNEQVVVSGSNYPSEEVARWRMAEWLKKFLPLFYLYKIQSHVVKEKSDEQTGDLQ